MIPQYDISVEKAVEMLDDGDGVGISQLIGLTGKNENLLDSSLRSLHNQGTIRYFPMEQPSAQKVAYWLGHPETPLDTQELEHIEKEKKRQMKQKRF